MEEGFMFTETLHSIFKEPNEIEDDNMIIENTSLYTIFQGSYLSSSLKTPDQTKEHKIFELYFLNQTKNCKITRHLKISRQKVYQTVESVERF